MKRIEDLLNYLESGLIDLRKMIDDDDDIELLLSATNCMKEMLDELANELLNN